VTGRRRSCRILSAARTSARRRRGDRRIWKGGNQSDAVPLDRAREHTAPTVDLSRHYIRKFISQTVGRSGHGKTSLGKAEALVIVSGRPLLGVTPDERVNVWIWNGEDPDEELQRRIMAAVLHYGINREEIEGRLFVDTGRETKIIIAEQTRN